MFSNRSMHDRRVASVLMPLYTRIMKETIRLTDYQQTVMGANTATGKDAEIAQFANLYLRKILSELESPRTFFKLEEGRELNVKPARKSAPYTARYIAENLHTLYERIDINDLNAFHTSSSHSRLYNSIVYYRMALLIAANTLEKGHGEKPAYFSGNTIKRYLHSLRVKSDRLVAIPSMVVDQFNEKSYLLANMDVRAALADGDICCGMEHFVMQGVQEAKNGGRLAPGIDLTLINDVKSKQSAQQLHKSMQVLEDSGMFDAAWYQKQYNITLNPLKDYCEKGYLEGRTPNAVFNQKWYCANNEDVKVESVIPASHYVDIGESEGRKPCEYFDAKWYREHYQLVDNDGLVLKHYLQEGRSKKLNPNAQFDVQYYLDTYPDVQAADIDPVEHYYHAGWREMRNPNAQFDAALYVNEHMQGVLNMNPVSHALKHHIHVNNVIDELPTDPPEQLIDEVETEKETEKETEGKIEAESDLELPVESPTDSDLPSLGDVAGNIKYFANPGPDFETPSNLDCSNLESKAKTIAFYLPQFHAFEENDQWWGKGFTEWRNVSRGTPRYSGHFQPRVPRDLGFYDLNDESVLYRQAEMAKQNGIEAFCFYYYWFNGTRLMDRPLDAFVNADIDQEFCIMWANENWTRTWDGFDSEVLIEQDYRDEDEDDFIIDTVKYFQHERYTRVNGRPLFIMYRPGLMPNARETFARWRDKWSAILGVEPWILMVQGFGDEDPTEFDLDGAVEFPPHKVCKDLPQIQDKLTIIDPNYSGYVQAYSDVITRSLGEKAPDFPLIKTVVPHWDNDARREGRGFTMHGSTPALYEKWLSGAIKYATKNPFENTPLVFVNAWNEWAEGAYLEPDVHYGHAYLNATKRAVHGVTCAKDRQKILLIGHDAYKHGAQMLLYSMAKTFQNQFGLDVTILLKQGGPLVKEYQAICRTVVIEQLGRENLDGWLRHEAQQVAICNTSVTGDLVPALNKAGIRVVSLIHELPNLIAEYNLGANLQHIADCADHVIFPSTIVQQGFAQFTSDVKSNQILQAQGLYKSIEYNEIARNQLRRELNIQPHEKMVLNVGYADLRKGFDIFLQVARQTLAERSDIHFVWAGDLAPDMKRWVQSDLDSAFCNKIHLIGFTEKMAEYYSACDSLLLTSREDPYPSVVLEAMCVGAPVVLFKEATGFDDLLSEHGHVVDRNDVPNIVRALVKSLFNDSRSAKKARIKYIEEHCRFDEYCFFLLQCLIPDIKKVSVVVPNYNYAEYMPERLQSIFNQTYPIFETIVLDDCSSDNSLDVINKVEKDTSRSIKIQANKKNSGNVFKQWKKGLKSTLGDFVWIAEADDLSEPVFLSRSIESFNSVTAMSFCDSIQTGTDNEILAKSYNYYYRTVDKTLFASDFRLEGRDFIQRAMSVRNVIMNVSSVVWRKPALEQALVKTGQDLFQYKLVGDWRLYLEVLAQKGQSIAYIAESLNTHRRHQSSVTHSMDHTAHVNEIIAMHEYVSEVLETDFALAEQMESYIAELRRQFCLDTVEKRDNRVSLKKAAA